MSAPWPSLEVRIKAGNYLTDTLLDFNKRFNDGRSVLEQYRTGDVSLHFHGFSGGMAYCLTSHAENGHVGGSANDARSDACQKKKMPVLINVGQGLQCFCPSFLRTIERLERLEQGMAWVYRP